MTALLVIATIAITILACGATAIALQLWAGSMLYADLWPVSAFVTFVAAALWVLAVIAAPFTITWATP